MTDFDVTEDVFQRGRFVLVQPKKGAHRAGLDALLLASVLPKGFDGHLVDLGSGAGAIYRIYKGVQGGMVLTPC